jgi:exo-beta-1,3-glucanase (GH17 family)
MKNAHNFSSSVITSFLIIFLGIISGWSSDQIEKGNEATFKQQKSDLLNGQVKAVAYSGFRHGQHPDRGEGAKNPGDEEILEDVKILTRDGNFKLIRLYDSQENSQDVLRIINENRLDVKVVLGIWLNAEISNHKGCPWLNEPIPQELLDENKVKNKKEIDTAIRLADEYKDIIVAVNVGNEALASWTDHKVSIDSVISYVRFVKNSIKQPVTVADNFKWWAEDGSDLAKVVDFVSIQVYPIWEGKDIDAGLSYTIANVKEVADSLPNTKIVITEAGWATIASEFGERASEEKQKQYYNELMTWAKRSNITTFFFEAFDEDWKGDPGNPVGAEKHWGLFTVDRKPKLVMQELYPDL